MPTSTPSNSLLWQTRLSLANIRLPWLIFTLLVFAGLIKLGLWQSERATAKEQRLARIETLSAQQGLPLEQMLLMQAQQFQPQSANLTEPLNPLLIEEFNDFPLLLTGRFDAQALFLLDNQVNKGQLGYKVLQVFYTENNAVLVNLGWVPGSINRQELPDVKTITGEHQFNGHVRYPEMGVMLMEQNLVKNQWPQRVQQIELDKFSQLLSKPLLPFVVYLDTKELLGYKKNWQPIVMPPEKHRAYAFQWFSLAIAWSILMVCVSGVVNIGKRQTNTKK